MANEPILRVTLTLMPGNKLHEATAAILSKIPKGQRTAFVCEKITNGTDRKVFLEEVRKTIRESIRQVPYVQVQPETYQEPELTDNDSNAEEVRRNFLGFLATLEEGDDGP